MQNNGFGSRRLYKISDSLLDGLDHARSEQSREFEFYEIQVHKRTVNGKPVFEVLIDEANSELINCVIRLKVDKIDEKARQ